MHRILFQIKIFHGYFISVYCRVLADCSQAASNPNEKILIAENITLLTTPYPLLDIPAITENYPDYVLDPNVTQNLNQVKFKNFILFEFIATHI